MSRLLRTLAFFCFLITVPTLVPYAQTLKELESQIQQAIKLNDYRKANSLIDGAIAKTKPGDRSNGNFLAAKGDLALRQKSYRAVIEWAEKAEKVLDKHPPDLITITNLINLGSAYLKSTDEDEQGMSMIYFEKVDKLLPKLPASSDFLQIGNRLMSTGNELIKPANPNRTARAIAIQLFRAATSAYQKGKDPVLAGVAQRQSFALAGGLLQEDEEDDDDEDDEKAQKVKAKPVGKPIAKKNAKAERIKFIFEQGAGMASTTGKTGSSTVSDVDLEKKLSGLTPAQKASVYREAGHSCLFEKKNYAKAESHLLQAISLMKQTGQLSGISAIWCYTDLSLLYALTGKYDKVPVHVKEAQKMLKEFNQRSFQFLSKGEEINEIWADMGEIRMAMGLTVLMQRQKPGLSIPQMHQLSYDVALYQNGLYLDRMRNIRTLIREKGTPQIRQLDRNLFIQKQLIANAPVSERKAALDKGKGIEEDLNEEFLELSNTVTSTPEVSWAQIKSRLKPDQAAVSFVRFGSYASSTGTINDTLYAAMIIRSASAAPSFVTLGSQRQLLQVLASSKTATGFYGRGGIVGSENTVKSGESIYNLVWKPIEAQLKGVTQIYFSVEGVLNQIAFAAIPFPGTTAKTAFKDRYVGGRYKLNQLFSTRQLVQGIQPFRLSAGMSSALFGDVNYESGPSNGSTKKTGNSKTGLDYVQTLLQKDQKIPFDRLDATRKEVEDIHRLLPNSKSITGADASKKRLLQFSGHSPTLLHVATHAVYVRPGVKRLDNTIDEALMRTALVFSGANQLWSPQSRFADDGLLTAYEISNQDFTQTRLVVLSACETALGDVRGTEGVFGLQRAFRMAGVEKLILSLWRVEDVATQQFMSLLYTNLKNNQEIRDAFYNAQVAMQKQADKPNQWAAFVLLE